MQTLFFSDHRPRILRAVEHLRGRAYAAQSLLILNAALLAHRDGTMHTVTVETQDSARLCVQDSYLIDGTRRVHLRHIDNPMRAVFRHTL